MTPEQVTFYQNVLTAMISSAIASTGPVYFWGGALCGVFSWVWLGKLIRGLFWANNRRSLEPLGRLERMIVLSLDYHATENPGEDFDASVIRRSIDGARGRPCFLGAFYIALDRLYQYGYINRYPGTERVPERGNRPRHYIALTDEGRLVALDLSGEGHARSLDFSRPSRL